MLDFGPKPPEHGLRGAAGGTSQPEAHEHDDADDALAAMFKNEASRISGKEEMSWSQVLKGQLEPLINILAALSHGCTSKRKPAGPDEVSVVAPADFSLRQKAPKTRDEKQRNASAPARSRSSRVGADGQPVASAMHPGVTNQSEDTMLEYLAAYHTEGLGDALGEPELEPEGHVPELVPASEAVEVEVTKTEVGVLSSLAAFPSVVAYQTQPGRYNVLAQLRAMLAGLHVISTTDTVSLEDLELQDLLYNVDLSMVALSDLEVLAGLLLMWSDWRATDQAHEDYVVRFSSATSTEIRAASEMRFGKGQWARLNAYGPGTFQTLFEDCPVFRAMCDAAGVDAILASLRASAEPRYTVGARVEVDFDYGWHAGKVESIVTKRCAHFYNVCLDGYATPAHGQTEKVSVIDLRPEGVELDASHHRRLTSSMTAGKMTIGSLFRLVHRWLLRNREAGYDAAGVEAVRAKCAQGAKGLLLLELCRRATREERAAMGERVKRSGLPVHTFFREMKECSKLGIGANMIPPEHTLQLEFYRQNDEIFENEGVEGVTEMRWDDYYVANYKTRPVPAAICQFYENRFGKPMGEPLSGARTASWNEFLYLKLHTVYNDFPQREAAGLFWGFGFRFTLRNAEGVAIKLSELDVAAFKSLELTEAAFGRMT